MTAKTLTEGALFEMEDCRVIEKMRGILDIKHYLVEKVEAHPTVNDANRLKVLRAIQNEMYHFGLMKLVSNYVLAHESKSLKVIQI